MIILSVDTSSTEGRQADSEKGQKQYLPPQGCRAETLVCSVAFGVQTSAAVTPQGMGAPFAPPPVRPRSRAPPDPLSRARWCPSSRELGASIARGGVFGGTRFPFANPRCYSVHKVL